MPRSQMATARLRKQQQNTRNSPKAPDPNSFSLVTLCVFVNPTGLKACTTTPHHSPCEHHRMMENRTPEEARGRRDRTHLKGGVLLLLLPLLYGQQHSLHKKTDITADMQRAKEKRGRERVERDSEQTNTHTQNRE